jgi:hypothetical protein
MRLLRLLCCQHTVLLQLLQLHLQQLLGRHASWLQHLRGQLPGSSSSSWRLHRHSRGCCWRLQVGALRHRLLHTRQPLLSLLCQPGSRCCNRIKRWRHLLRSGIRCSSRLSLDCSWLAGF